MTHTVKVYVDELEFGMYVSELDRPWLESPFMFQGFKISNQSELEQLRNLCEYVYIDPVESMITHPPGSVTADKHKTEKPGNSDSAEAADGSIFHFDVFKQKLKRTLAVHHTAHTYIKQVMEDIRFGKSLNVQKAKQIVSTLADSIVDNSTVLIWLTNLKDRDEYTSQHSLNVCILSLLFGQGLSFNKEKLEVLGIGALLHDIGKLKVPLNILNKPDRLTEAEFDLMKKHPLFGYELLKEGHDLEADSLDIIRHHHEHLDGTGYPDGVKAEQLNRFTRMVAIVDKYDAVTSRRIYHDEATPYDALNKLYHERNGIIDHNLLQKFIKYIGIYPVGSVVELNSGHVGIVMATSEKHHLQPILMLVRDHHKQPYETHKFVNLANPALAKKHTAPKIARVLDPNQYDIDLKTVCLDQALDKAG